MQTCSISVTGCTWVLERMHRWNTLVKLAPYSTLFSGFAIPLALAEIGLGLGAELNSESTGRDLNLVEGFADMDMG